MTREIETAGVTSVPKEHTELPLSVQVQVKDEGDQRDATAASLPDWVTRWGILALVLVIAGIYVGRTIGSGWVPADDGILNQSALRVMQGQLPHRDFAEIYTGLLSVIHAMAFRIIGVSLFSLRLCVFLFFLAWIPAVYFIALRFTSAIAAGLITLVAVAWSYPNYPAAMPSWYNLFFATFGAAALLRYLDVRRTRWLFLAGVCGGVSILIKVIGAYYIAGALLSLAFLEQTDAQDNGTIADASLDHKNSAIPYRIFSVGSLLLFLATLLYFFHARLGVAEFYHFILPAGALVTAVLLGERHVCGIGAAQRFAGLFKVALPFVAGVLAPVVLFLLPYARSGSVAQFFSGVTSSAIARSVGLGVMRPMSVEYAAYGLGLAALVAAAMYLREFQGKLIGGAVATGLLVVLLKANTLAGIISGVWFSVATLTPLVVLAGASVLLADAKAEGSTKLQRQRVMVLASLAAMCSLAQFPFAAPIYLCYALPLTLLAAVAVITTARKHPGTYVLGAFAAFYLLFGASLLVPDHVYELTHKVGPLEELHLARGGGVRIEYAPEFADLIRLLQQHSPNGSMYAGNDCPELYFLAGLRNVTRDDGGATAQDVLKALQSDDLKLVVINEAPFFPSAKMSSEVRKEVQRRFPESRQVGIFHVFWRP
jgi:Dolichyl-phosphate-mannose-protein mannosyltransferase